MNLLAIDTSTEKASVALLVKGRMICEEQDSQKTQAQLLLPLIDTLLVDGGSSLNQLDGIVFGCGPGSFTGLRIACSIAKGLAYAHDLALFPVSSLAAITWAVRQQLNDPKVPILAVLDARMHELYWGFFEASSYNALEHVNKAEDIQLVETHSLVLAGVGIETYWPNIPDLIKDKTTHQLLVYPNAAAMIEMVSATGIRPVSVAQAQPVYIRNQVTQGDARG